MKKKILIVGISIIGLISILPFIKKDKLIKENIPNNYNTELAVNISEDGTNYNIVDEIPTTGYELNSSKSICKTQNETSGIENAPKDTNITIEYKEGKINFLGVTKQRTRCYLYFDKKDTDTIHVSFGDIEVNRTTPDFSKVATIDEGIFKAEDGMYGGTSYYWRGAVTNNYVKFAGKCWRIIRINGDGTIRLIYDGSSCHVNGSNTTNSIAVAGTAYNTSHNKSYYVGWTYGSAQRPSTANPQTGGTASNAKTQLEAWYNNNIGNNTTYSSKMADGKYCNDRTSTTSSGESCAWTATGGTFYYGAYHRINTGAPTLSCTSGDIYSLKVGLITADEVMYAGGKGANNTSYYLYNGQYYWTMSPHYWNGTISGGLMFVADSNGALINVHLHSTYGLRPVINLKADTQFQSGGNGSLDNPYVVL